MESFIGTWNRVELVEEEEKKAHKNFLMAQSKGEMSEEMVDSMLAADVSMEVCEGEEETFIVKHIAKDVFEMVINCKLGEASLNTFMGKEYTIVLEIDEDGNMVSSSTEADSDMVVQTICQLEEDGSVILNTSTLKQEGKEDITFTSRLTKAQE